MSDSEDEKSIKGFEEFIEFHLKSKKHLLKPQSRATTKEDKGPYVYNFLANDYNRLTKLNNLFTEKIPFVSKFDQSEILISEQKNQLELIKKYITSHSLKHDSDFRKSMREVFDNYFKEE